MFFKPKQIVNAKQFIATEENFEEIYNWLDQSYVVMFNPIKGRLNIIDSQDNEVTAFCDDYIIDRDGYVEVLRPNDFQKNYICE